MSEFDINYKNVHTLSIWAWLVSRRMIIGIYDEIKPGVEVTVKATSKKGKATEFKADCRLDTPCGS